MPLPFCLTDSIRLAIVSPTSFHVPCQFWKQSRPSRSHRQWLERARILGFSFGRAWVVEGAEEAAAGAAAVGAAFGANGIRMGAGAVKSNVRFDNEGTALA